MSHIVKRVISTLAWSKKLSNPYAKDPKRKQVIEKAVTDYANNSGLDARGADKGEIMWV
jgi:hypothetical protein